MSMKVQREGFVRMSAESIRQNIEQQSFESGTCAQDWFQFDDSALELMYASVFD